MEFLTYALLGLGTGAVNVLLANALVLTYRGSGVINFAQGSFALVGAYTMVQLCSLHTMPFAVGVLTAVVAAGAVGLLVQVVLMRAMRTASPLARVIATLGVLTVVTQSILLKYGVEQRTVSIPLPTEPVRWGSVVVPKQNLYLVVVAVLVTALLWAVVARTRAGRAVTAAAESPRIAASLGWSPGALASATWTAGGAVAGLAGALFPATSTGFVSTTQLSPLIVAALATALLAGFRNFWISLVAGLGIGMAQSLATGYIHQTGVADATPFLFIVLVLALRGRGLPVRGTLTDRLPRVGSADLRAPYVLFVGGGLLTAAGLLMPESWYPGLIISTTFAIVGLSLVVLTGYAGQLSLAQFALGGVGAYAAGRLAAAHGWSMVPALGAGVIAAMLVGFLVGLPALRTRGVNLAVITFGLGFAIYALVFSNSEYTGGSVQTRPENLHFFSVPVDPITHAGNYSLVCLVFLILTVALVVNLRRSRSGRRLLAVRTNERAAAALGVDVFQAKLYAFTLSAAIAGLGGALLGLSYPTILFQQIFTPDASISALVLVVIGGVGYALGPVVGSVLAVGGLATVVFDDTTVSAGGGPAKYLPLVTGMILLLTLVTSQDGVVERARVPLPSRRLRTPLADLSPVQAPTNDIAGNSLPLSRPGRVEPRTLSATCLVQRFGSFTALDDVEVTVRPGEVLGILGPNGAGKTTLIDVLTGYATPVAGSVSLDGVDITSWRPHRRARAGLARSFQTLELFDDLTVRENLQSAADRRDLTAYVTDLVMPGSRPLGDQVRAAIAELELADVLARRPEELSYGQRRLVAIARAVAAGPSILLLDEPAAGLDEHQTAEVGHLIRRLADDWGIGVLLIEHDVSMVMRTADRIQVLDFGRTIAEGTPAEIHSDQTVLKAYIGESEDEFGSLTTASDRA